MLTFISKFLRWEEGIGDGGVKASRQIFNHPSVRKKTEKRKKDDGGRGGVGCLFIRRKSGPLGANEIDDVSSEGFKVNRSCEGKMERKKERKIFYFNPHISIKRDSESYGEKRREKKYDDHE